MGTLLGALLDLNRLGDDVASSLMNLHNHDKVRVTVVTSALKLSILPTRLILVDLPHPQNIRSNSIRMLVKAPAKDSSSKTYKTQAAHSNPNMML